MKADLDAVFFNTNDFAESASVSRDATTVTMNVIVGSQKIKTRKSHDFEISRNWVILKTPTSQYDFGTGVVEPLTTDKFTVDGRNFQPRKPDGMGHCWEYSDGTSDVIKIFVEEV